ncbi:hypothetical protein B0H11DRAFT_1998444 [Mycena galericulata]|nr:hypothetical protein B0H11DRAFT_1998444 [Mycena galericulata]
MINPNDPLVQLKITSATCSFFAMGTTVYRLYRRRGRLWADDAWAFFAFVALIIQVVAVFLHLPIPNSLSHTARVAVYYLMAMTFYAVIWASRLSILFSIVRIDPVEERRKLLSWVAVPFVAAALFLFAQLLWVCEPEPAWKNTPNPQCHLSLEVAICQVVNKALRKKLTLIFSTCVVTTIVSLVHAAFILRNGGIKVVISALVEDCLSLIVANIPVVVTSLVNLVGEDQNDTVPTTTLRFTPPWAQNTGRGITTSGTGLMVTVGSNTLGEDSRTAEQAGSSDAETGKQASVIAWNPDRSQGTVVVNNSSSTHKI